MSKMKKKARNPITGERILHQVSISEAYKSDGETKIREHLKKTVGTQGMSESLTKVGQTQGAQ